MEQQDALLKSDDLKGIFFRFLGPSMVGMFFYSIYCIADILFIGVGVSSEGMAAAGLCMPVFTIYNSLGYLVGIGCATTVAIAKGQEEFRLAHRVFTLAVVVNLTVASLITVTGMLFTRQLAQLLGATPDMIDLVVEYLKPVNYFAIPMILSTTFQGIIRGDGNPRLVMVAMLVSSVMNVVLDYVFIFKFHLGIFGASLATGIGTTIGLMLMMLHFLLHRNTIFLVRHFWSLRLLRRLLKNGTGSLGIELSAGVVTYLFNFSLLRVAGSLAVSIYSVLSNLAAVAKGIFNSVAFAAQPLISTNYGAYQIPRVAKSFRLALGTALAAGGVMMALMFIFPEELMSCFTRDNLQLITEGAEAIRVYFSSLLFTAVNTIFIYFLQSVERAVSATIIAILRGGVFVALGLAILIPLLGELGIWLTILFAEGVTFLCGLALMLREFARLRQIHRCESGGENA